MSTPMFAEYANYFNGALHPCDISLENINAAKKFTKNYENKITYYNEDSLIFLQKFNKPIDLLYLDSLDGHDTELASRHQLFEAEIAIKKLHDKSLILLDDKGTKTNLSLDFFLENNFQILFETRYQVLLSKRKFNEF